jgi:membrane-associated phospholipid phosphatase
MINARWLLTYGLLITVGVIGIGYAWVDIPLIEWAHTHDMRQYKWLHTAQQLPELFPYLAFIVMVFVGIRSCWATLTRIETALLYTSISYVFVSFLTKMFKMVFARTWPATWVDNNPSWLNDQVFGFFWFIDAAAYRSFPSGHTAAMFAVVVVLCHFYRSLRFLSGLACALVIAGLISNYYHYFSDIVAGAYLGTLTGLITISFSKDSRGAFQSSGV